MDFFPITVTVSHVDTYPISTTEINARNDEK